MLITLRRLVLILGLLTAVGLFAVDMYLPALPAMARDLNASAEAIQVSLVAFLLTVGLGQLIAGPISDVYGRRKPLLIGLGTFIAGSVGCAAAPNIEVLIAFRIIQGIGACAVMVTPRAVVRDQYTGPEAARVMSLLTVVYSVSPILAPLAGSWITDLTSWRGVFAAIAGLAILAALFVILQLPETKPNIVRLDGQIRYAIAGYRAVLFDRPFLAMSLITSLTFAGWFIYAANSSFIITGYFGTSPREYAVLFALNSVSFVAASQMNGRLTTRYGLALVLRAAIVAHCVTTLSLLLLTLSGHGNLAVLVIGLFIGFGLNGIIVPTAVVLAMANSAVFSGTASALIGTCNFAGGAMAVAIVAPFSNGSPLPMVAGIAACSAAVLAIGMTTLQLRTPSRNPEPVSQTPRA